MCLLSNIISLLTSNSIDLTDERNIIEFTLEVAHRVIINQ